MSHKQTQASESTPAKVHISKQTFFDLGMWLSTPNEHSELQLANLLDSQKRLAIISLANKYWLIGALTHSLKNSNVWSIIDDELSEYLDYMEQIYLERSQSIKDEAIFACQLLQDADIKVVMLKGGANLFTGVANPISSRFMTDIDLLIPEDKQQQANDVLMAAGYQANKDENLIKHVAHHHAPPLYREGGACCIELHRQVLKKSATSVLSTSEVWQQAIELPITAQLSVLQLTPEQQVLLSVAHSELSHKGYKEHHVDLRQLLNLNALARHHAQQLEWQNIMARFVASNEQNALLGILTAAKRLLSLTTPLDSSLNTTAEQHFLRCLQKFEKQQGSAGKFKVIQNLVESYNKEKISIAYGYGRKAVAIGRMKHLKRHFLMATQVKYLKRLYNKLFNKIQ